MPQRYSFSFVIKKKTPFFCKTNHPAVIGVIVIGVIGFVVPDEKE
jgi:hypothetical protein